MASLLILVVGINHSLAQDAPGGVSSDLQLWLKADAGVTESGGNVSLWEDQSANSMGGTGINTPTITSNANNFNPTINFDRASSEYFDLPDGFADFTNGLSVYVVANLTSAGGWERLFDFGNGEADNNILLSRQGTTDNLVFGAYNGGTNNSSIVSNVITNNTIGIHSVIQAGGTAGTTNVPSFFKDGVSISNSDDAFIANNITRTSNYIGRSNWAVDADYNGEISEIILYNADATATERQQIESYLALKYGITLGQGLATAYLASDGTTKMWDETVNASYNNDIFGIGRDDAQALDQ
ncbi:MAG: LamG domain-containing protein, partial [Proteobacteria bacterium]|nr:LamG domain-containing protein [Pseudomonadota bacterium]